MLLIGLTIISLFARPVFAMASATAPDTTTPIYLQDVFVFSSNEDPQRLIVAFTAAELKSDTIYQFNFDTNRDGIEDRVIQATFSDTDPRHATITEPALPERTGETISPADARRLSGPVSMHASPEILMDRDIAIRAFAGLRDDPRGGPDFAGAQTYAVVVEVPLPSVLAEHKSDLDIWVSVYERSTN